MTNTGDNGSYRIPAEMLQALIPAMQGLGITPPDVKDMVPTINLATPVRDLGIQLGQLLAKAGLFQFGPNRRLIAMRNGRFESMTSTWFCSWVEKHVKVVKTYKAAGGGSYDAEVSMGKDLAAKLLETDELLRELPKLQQILAVRVPVKRKLGHYELCKVGWDEDAEVYCTNDIDFELDWSVDKSRFYIESLCGEMPFADKSGDLWSNRSFLVHVSSMLGVFVRRLLAPGTVRPLIFVMANDQGSGKSLLVSMILSPCFGLASSTDLPVSSKGLNPEKFTALLETVAQSMKEFLWLDDVPPNIWSNSLNRFITAPAHTGRKYGGNDEMFEAPAVTQVFMTGNMPEATRDLMQRALVCELFLAQASENIRHGFEMTSNWLAEPAQRRQILSSLWAFVREWIAAGGKPGTHRQSRATDWSGLVSGILQANGIEANPFAIPDLPTGGDRETEEWKTLLIALADEAEAAEVQGEGQFEVDTTKLVTVARQLKLLMDLVGSEDDKALKGGELKRLGRRLGKWRGRADLRSTSGRLFQFGRRKQSSNWVYPVTWLDAAPAAADE